MSAHRILVLGGSGMLGHVMARELSSRHDTWITLREHASQYGESLSVFADRHISGVCGQNFESVIHAFAAVKPTVVVNCIGVVKQVGCANNALKSISVNSLFPHRLAELCGVLDARLITFSTDCVFSGQKGGYTEADLPDPYDLYGRSKLLGEVSADRCLTLRTSMIGRQVRGSHGLLEWFINQSGKNVKGYKRAVFSGFTTSYLSRLTIEIVENHPELYGVYHLSAKPIDKFDLLTRINRALDLKVTIQPDESVQIDRSLDCSRILAATNLTIPTWDEMIEELSQSQHLQSKRLVNKC